MVMVMLGKAAKKRFISSVYEAQILPVKIGASIKKKRLGYTSILSKVNYVLSM